MSDVINIFISCGEPSGDMYAADFVRELLKLRDQARLSAQCASTLRTLNPARPAVRTLNIYGMYGPMTQEVLNREPEWDYEQLKLMGFLEVLPAIPRILKLKNNIIHAIIKNSPDAVILIDFPDFHLILARGLRKSGYSGKIISLIPPTVWAWREGRIKNLKRDFDLCLPLFRFEHDFLINHGVKSLWSAHPLAWSVNKNNNNNNIIRGMIAIMPGSRRYDIKYHADILINTAKILIRDGYKPVFSIASGLSQDIAEGLKGRLEAEGLEYAQTGRELMSRAEAVIAVSGTVAVEAMMLRRFTVVIYNMNKFSYFILKRLVHAPHISTPNYMAESPVFPELLCGNARPERITSELYKYLREPDVRAEIDGRLERACAGMGDGNAAEFWVRSVLEIIKSER